MLMQANLPIRKRKYLSELEAFYNCFILGEWSFGFAGLWSTWPLLWAGAMGERGRMRNGLGSGTSLQIGFIWAYLGLKLKGVACITAVSIGFTWLGLYSKTHKLMGTMEAACCGLRFNHLGEETWIVLYMFTRPGSEAFSGVWPIPRRCLL